MPAKLATVAIVLCAVVFATVCTEETDDDFVSKSLKLT